MPGDIFAGSPAVDLQPFRQKNAGELAADVELADVTCFVRVAASPMQPLTQRVLIHPFAAYIADHNAIVTRVDDDIDGEVSIAAVVDWVVDQLHQRLWN